MSEVENEGSVMPWQDLVDLYANYPVPQGTSSDTADVLAQCTRTLSELFRRIAGSPHATSFGARTSLDTLIHIYQKKCGRLDLNGPSIHVTAYTEGRCAIRLKNAGAENAEKYLLVGEDAYSKVIELLGRIVREGGREVTPTQKH